MKRAAKYEKPEDDDKDDRKEKAGPKRTHIPSYKDRPEDLPKYGEDEAQGG